MRSRGVALVADAVQRSAAHIVGFFRQLRYELGGYIGCLNLAHAVQGHAPTIFPEIADHFGFRCADLRDAGLVLSLGDAVVGNDVEATGRPLVFVTGANRGGKSTFLRSLGLAQRIGSAPVLGSRYRSRSITSDVLGAFGLHGPLPLLRLQRDDALSPGLFRAWPEIGDVFGFVGDLDAGQGLQEILERDDPPGAARAVIHDGNRLACPEQAIRGLPQRQLFFEARHRPNEIAKRCRLGTAGRQMLEHIAIEHVAGHLGARAAIDGNPTEGLGIVIGKKIGHGHALRHHHDIRQRRFDFRQSHPVHINDMGQQL
jgi:hypothetical protein